MAEDIFLSVVIPSYNETENLKSGVLATVRDYLKKQKYSWEVVISDDGSPETEAVDLAKNFCEANPGFRFLENEHGGKPFALWAGIQETRGQVVLFTDMDQSAPISEVEKLLPYYSQGYEVVIGSRGTQRKKFSLFRKIASTVFRLFRQSLLLSEITDTQAGFKSFKRGVGIALFPKLQVIRQGRTKAKGWSVGSWDAEFLFIADKRGYRIKEVPILWENRDLAMGSKRSNQGGKFIKESIEMVGQIFRVRLNNWRGYYGR